MHLLGKKRKKIILPRFASASDAYSWFWQAKKKAENKRKMNEKNLCWIAAVCFLRIKWKNFHRTVIEWSKEKERSVKILYWYKYPKIDPTSGRSEFQLSAPLSFLISAFVFQTQSSRGPNSMQEMDFNRLGFERHIYIFLLHPILLLGSLQISGFYIQGQRNSVDTKNFTMKNPCLYLKRNS